MEHVGDYVEEGRVGGNERAAASAALEPGAVVQRLMYLGMDRREAELYVRLATLGAARPSAIAAGAAGSRTDMYRLLQAMAARGLVAVVPGKPMRYQAVSIERVLQRQIAEAHATLHLLQESGDELRRALDVLAGHDGPHAGPSAPGFQLVHGRLAAMRHAFGMLEHARRSFRLVSTHDSIGRLARATGLMAALARRAADDVHSTLIVPEPSVAALGGAAPGVEVLPARVDAALQFVVVDGREALVWLAHDADPSAAAEGDLCVWFDGRPGLDALGLVFDALVERRKRPSAVHGAAPPRGPSGSAPGPADGEPG